LLVGLVTGILVVGLHVDAFVATLGTSRVELVDACGAWMAEVLIRVVADR